MSRPPSQITCCCFDLETTNLAADYGIILCAVIKSHNQRPTVLRLDNYSSWKNQRSNDKAIVKDIIQQLAQYDIWIAHNGAKFDVPFLRTRALGWNLQPVPTKKLIDPVQLARNKLRMSFNSLEKVAEHMGCNLKTDVQPKAWLRAALDGDRKSMNYIVNHCIFDVMTLERVITHLKDYSTTFNTWGSGF